MSAKRFIYCEEENGEFPFPYIKNTDGKSIISLYECCDLLNSLNEENEQLKSKLGSAEKVFHNLGRKLVYSETYEKWLIE